MTRIIKVLSLFQDCKGLGCPVVNTTSRSLGWQRDLSPFTLGPCKLYGRYVSSNMENGWQYSKVYKQHDVKGEPSKDYWPWAVGGWNGKRAVRYPMGKGAKPEYSWWDGERLSYVEARKRIYVPLYAKAVRRTPGWLKLKALYKSNKVLVLQDFDAYDHAVLGMTLTDVMNNPDRKMGHAFVLAMLLQEDDALDETEMLA